jgi:hypothetical protein
MVMRWLAFPYDDWPYPPLTRSVMSRASARRNRKKIVHPATEQRILTDRDDPRHGRTEFSEVTGILIKTLSNEVAGGPGYCFTSFISTLRGGSENKVLILANIHAILSKVKVEEIKKKNRR